MAKLFPHFQLSERLGKKIVEVDARTVAELIEKGRERFGPEFDNELGMLTILVNGRNIRYFKGYSTPLGADDEVAFVLPSAGG